MSDERTAAADSAGKESGTLHYVYGVTRAGVDLPRHIVGVGDGRPVLAESADLALLTNPVPAELPLATQRNLLAHSHLLDAVAERTTVLPVRYGTVVESLDTATKELLDGRRDECRTRLDDLEGTVQFSLRATYREDVVLAEVVAEDDEVRRLNEVTRDQPPDAARPERMRLGELVVAALEARRRGEAEAVVGRLTKHARAFATRDPGSPPAVLDVAFLVEVDEREAFERDVDTVGRELAARMGFRLIGPQAPYDFVD